MKFHPLFGKKINKDADHRPERLTPEEERELEGPMPDMMTEEVDAKAVAVGPEGDVTVEEKVSVPEKGVLRTENLVKKYGKRTVASNVSIEVTQGEIVGLLGPNGAGKTTTFYMTVGLITPNGGKVFLDNQDITGFPVYKRAQAGIGYLPQEASVFRTLTVENNIRAILEMTNTSKEYQKAKLEQLIKEFSLEKVRHNVRAVSAGARR